MNKILKLVIFSAFLCAPSLIHADTLSLTTYYPAPFGSYSQLKLVAQADGSPGLPSCVAATDAGNMYMSSTSGSLKICNGTAWGDPGLWDRNANNIYLRDSHLAANEAWRMGFGTQTPNLKLTLRQSTNNGDSGILALGTAVGTGATLNATGAGTKFIWYPRQAAFRAGAVSGAQWDNANIGQYSAGLGSNNQVSGTYSSILGGSDNTVPAAATYAVIGGGQTNTASGAHSTVMGGEGNTASGGHATVGGMSNTASNSFATVSGGKDNLASGDRSFIGAGTNNAATASYASIAAGFSNTASGTNSFVGGGQNNSATGSGAAVGGGVRNTASGANSFVGGGGGAVAGNENIAGPGLNAAVVGGGSNTASGIFSFVGGGNTNKAYANDSVVTGGQSNTAGVLGNAISGAFSSVGGGSSNTASGQYAAIPGGSSNTVSGTYGFAAGRNHNVQGSDSVGMGNGATVAAGGTFVYTPSAANVGTANVASFYPNNDGALLVGSSTNGAAGNGGPYKLYVNGKIGGRLDGANEGELKVNYDAGTRAYYAVYAP